ncbi:MAG TPA: hypothetical protein VFI54_02320 [Solirubrobacteraceae bacterium]|nr:hypothetical protein [Solirubrobacteraceae bacterium]
MTTDTIHPLAAEYLERLRRAGRRLPAGRRRELLAEIEGHLSEAIEPGASDAQALTVLDKLGDPEGIIAAEMPRQEPPDRRGAREWTAIILLLFGGFVFAVGWFAGLILLWSSRAWSTRDKWIGTFVIPGGLATAFVALIVLGEPEKKLCRGFPGGAQHCTNAGGSSAASSILGVALLVFLVLAPIATAIYLAAMARRDRIRL